MSSKKKHEPEYTLHVFHSVHPETNEAVTALVVQTTREFVSFKYEIPLESTIAETTIDLKIHGLRVPENLVPGKGRARGVVFLQKLRGSHDLFITNVDGVTNRFTINSTNRTVEVKQLSRKPFVVHSSEAVRI